jgi:hypothetical protein
MQSRCTVIVSLDCNCLECIDTANPLNSVYFS